MKNLTWKCVILFLTVGGFSTPENSYAQENSRENLQVRLSEAENDTVRADLYNELSYMQIVSGAFEEAEENIDKAIEISQNIGYTAGEAYAYRIKGILYDYLADTYNALKFSRQSLDLYREIGDTVGIAAMESNIGAVYLGIGDATAIDYLIPALKKGEELKDTNRITSVMLNLAALYYNQLQQPEKAEQYYRDTRVYLDAGFEGDNIIRTNYLAGQGEFQLFEENYEEAFETFSELLTLEQESPYHSEVLRKMGRAQFGLENYEEAEKYFQQAIEVGSKDEFYQDVAAALTWQGKAVAKRNPSRAAGILEEAYLMAESGGYIFEMQDVSLELYKLYQQIGQYDKALGFHEKYLVLKDSIFNINANDKVRFAQLNFDLDKKEDQIQLLEQQTEITELQQKRQKSVTVATVAVAGLLLILALGMFNRYKFIKKANRIIHEEKSRSDRLLLNILPEETAQELRDKGSVEAKRFESVTVMFTDFKGFTKTSETMTPEELVKNVDHFFSKFDEIMEKYGLEKIKTIGDSYMCAGGLPFPIANHAQKMILAAMDILKFIDEVRSNPDDGIPGYEVRIGIHTGPVVAGVVGTKKFAYDIWGDTVNVASRMESSSSAGRINISEITYAMVKDQFLCNYRGEVEVKNKGTLRMYYVNGIKDPDVTSMVQ